MARDQNSGLLRPRSLSSGARSRDPLAPRNDGEDRGSLRRLRPRMRTMCGLPQHPALSRPHQEGRIAIVTNVEAGCGGRGGDARRAAPTRTAKSCGPGAPTLASRSWTNSRTTVAKEPGTKETVKTIAQGMPDFFGEPVVTMLVCFIHFAREAAGATGARHSLCPVLEGSFMHHSGRVAPRGRGPMLLSAV